MLNGVQAKRDVEAGTAKPAPQLAPKPAPTKFKAMADEVLPKVALCAAISLIGGVALGLIIGVNLAKKPADAFVAADRSAYAAVIALHNSSLTWNGVTYGGRKVMNATGPAVQTVSGVATYVIGSTDADFNVFYQNFLSEETLVHAHGMTPPWTFDGVPFLSAAPFSPGDEQLYRYPLTAASGGTYFLHAHFHTDHGQGMVMPFIVRAAPPSDYPDTETQALANAQDVLLLLQEFCPFYNGPDTAIAANASNPTCADDIVIAAVDQAMAAMNSSGTGTGGGDGECLSPTDRLSVRWRAQMANGRFLTDPLTVAVDDGAEYVRLRIINAASQTNYLVHFGGLPATVVAADGAFVKPRALSDGSIWVGVSQRLDVLLRIPEGDLTEPVLVSAREESDDYSLRSGIVLYRGSASAPSAPGLPAYAVNTSAAGWWRDLSQERSLLQAFTPLSARAPDREYALNLTGHHGTINGRTYFEYPAVAYARNPAPLRVRYGERVHVTMTNRTPEPHAMHLHGHHFQIVAVDGTPIPDGGGAVRDTVMIPAGCHSVTIAFDAINPGVHEFHCHMAYDMMAGMITTIEYVPGGQYIPDAPAPADGGHGGH